MNYLRENWPQILLLLVSALSLLFVIAVLWWAVRV